MSTQRPCAGGSAREPRENAVAGAELRLFGGFRLLGPGGEEIPLRLMKERALLAYLALHPDKPFTREHLAALLWGDQPEEKARHSLSQALSSIGRALARAGVAPRRGQWKVTLPAGAVGVDVARFETWSWSSDPRDLRRAVEMYEPDPLGDLRVEEPPFEDWALEVRGRCHERVITAGLAYLSRLGPHGPDAELAGIAQLLVRLEPCSEPAHQALIRLYLDAGQPGAAMRQLRACRDALESELGVSPGPETVRLARRLEPGPDTAAGAGVEVASSSPWQDLPSVVVLPIVNVAEDPNLVHLVTGLTDDITTELTRYRSLFVISRDSAFSPGVADQDVSTLCRRFGVRHALRGSLRRRGRGFRANVRLVDADTGRNLWAERYDMSREELMGLADDVTARLVGCVAAWLEQDQWARAQRKPARDWTAYEHLLHGLTHHHRNWHRMRNTLRAIQHFERAIALDPGCARAHAYLGCAKAWPWFKERRHEQLDPCLAHAHRAVELDPAEPEGHRVLGGVYLIRGEHELSRHHFEEAERLHPGHAHVLAHYARYHMHAGSPRKAMASLGRARQLNPLHPGWYWESFGIASFLRSDYEAAIDAFGRMEFHSFYDHLYAAAANACLDRERRAKHHIAVALEHKPGLRLSSVSYYLPYRRRDDLDRVREGLSRAGLR